MAEVNETSQRQCDRCGAQSDPAAKGIIPEGWLAGALQVFADLCPACAGLPVAQAVISVEPAA